MFNQNIISNKFDLNLSTTLSSYMIMLKVFMLSVVMVSVIIQRVMALDKHFNMGYPIREYSRGNYLCTVDLLFDQFEISCMITDNFCFYFQNRLFQTSQTGGQWYTETSPFSIPCPILKNVTYQLQFGQFLSLQFSSQVLKPVIVTFSKLII